MEAYREIITGKKLCQVIDLPDALRFSELEVIILPLNNKIKAKEKNILFNWADLPKHKMGKELSRIDRENMYSDER
jgi:hypothetical protein